MMPRWLVSLTANLMRALSLLLLLHAFAGNAKADPVSAVSSAIGGVGSMVGGILGSSAADKAAKQMQEAVKAGQQQISTGVSNANTTLKDLLSGVSGNLSPYLATGTAAAGDLTAALGPGGRLNQQFSFNPTDLQNDPGYQFQLQQGMQAINRAAAAQGTANSGGTLKSIMNYAQGLAGTTYNQAYQRAASTFGLNQDTTLRNIMAGVQTGLSGTGMSNQATEALGGQQAQNTMQGAVQGAQLGVQGGQAAAAGTMGAANAWSNALTGIGSAATGYATNSMLSGFLNNGSNPGGGAPPGFMSYDAAKPFSMPTAGPPSVNMGAVNPSYDPNVLASVGLM